MSRAGWPVTAPRADLAETAAFKRTLDRHGGRIWAEAEPGKRAAFYFALPECQKVL
jgi:light-regulated signal transduction histidine kinase (bacteriophytochrome)